MKGRAQRVVVNGPASEATSSAPQGSVLGLVLLNIFINDLDAGVKCTISKFTKLGAAVDSPKGQKALQWDLDRLEHWTIRNGVKFDKKKCQILHPGRSNARHKREEVLVDSRLNTSQECVLAAKRANCILQSVKHSITGQ